MKAKKKKPVAAPVVKGTANRIRTDMPFYFRTLDWSEMWEDWFCSITPGGDYKYKSVKAFAAARAESPEQRQFLCWYLGVLTEGEPSKYPSVHGAEPQNWAEKRRTGGWFTDANLRKFGVEIRRRINALDALREAGSITLNSLVRAEQMAQQIDKAFGGQMFSGDLGFEANLHRADWYIKLQSRVQMLKDKAQEMYAKSHGINFQDMAGLVQLMSAAAMNTAQKTDQGPSREEAALSAVVRMAMAKSARYNLELPADAVEVIGEEVEKQTRKKSLN